MSAAEVSQRLASIAKELEALETSIWLLHREREQLRHQLRLLNAPPRDGTDARSSGQADAA